MSAYTDVYDLANNAARAAYDAGSTAAEITAAGEAALAAE